MAPKISDLVASKFVDFSKKTISSTKYLDYYLNTKGGNVSVGGGAFGSQTIASVTISQADQVFLQSTLSLLEKSINIDFLPSTSPTKKGLNIYYDSTIENNSQEGVTLGTTVANSAYEGNWNELFINDGALKNNQPLRRYTLLHELGHSLGLEHPFDGSDGDFYVSTDASKSATPDETVMSYRINSSNALPDFFTEADLSALKSIWGERVQGMITNQYAKDNLASALTGVLLTFPYPSYSAIYYNLGGGRYGVQQKGKSTIDEITGATSLQFQDQAISLASDVAATFNQVKGIDDVSGVVFRLCNAAFARLPDANGLENWINGNKSGGQTYASSALEFSKSQEFKNRYGSNVTDTQYVTTLYNNVLGRDPDAGGLAHYQGLLASGKDRGSLLLDFSESPENRGLFTKVTGLS